MSAGESVSIWIREVIDGNEDAAQQLWDRYFPDLLRIARNRLRSIPKRMADEEDVALSALNSFFGAAQKGRFPDLADRDSLWRLLSRITQRKAVDVLRRHLAQKRGGATRRHADRVQTAFRFGVSSFRKNEPKKNIAINATGDCDMH
jgi:DNA-directed RNA polymerase specialized sigma24 family protein